MTGGGAPNIISEGFHDALHLYRERSKVQCGLEQKSSPPKHRQKVKDVAASSSKPRQGGPEVEILTVYRSEKETDSKDHLDQGRGL